MQLLQLKLVPRLRCAEGSGARAVHVVEDCRAIGPCRERRCRNKHATDQLSTRVNANQGIGSFISLTEGLGSNSSVKLVERVSTWKLDNSITCDSSDVHGWSQRGAGKPKVVRACAARYNRPGARRRRAPSFSTTPC
eukprot:8840362-Pyramimonas_sp.AAC.1